ncbi:class A beta-lactamase [Spirillospora sp. CA-108201]
MPSVQSGSSRRALLAAAALLPPAGCGGKEEPSSATPPPSARPSAVAPDPSRFAALERRHGARLGVYALATRTGAEVAYRADERFAFCSTFKVLAAAAVLHGNPLGHLDERVAYTRADVNSISPVTEDRVATGMTVRELCDAAIRFSDGTAGNLLMRDAGGPARLTAYLRGLGDTVSRMDDYEPELNRVRPGDPRDTTTSRAIAADYRALVLGDALEPAKRALVRGWLERSATAVGAERIRAGLPRGWRAASKTGTGDYGRANDIAVVWPPRGAPLMVAVMSDRRGYGAPPRNALIAEAAALVASDLSRAGL